MKKLLTLGCAIFLFACGSPGDHAGVSSNGDTGGTPSSGSGTITVNFPSDRKLQRTIANADSMELDHARLVVRKTVTEQVTEIVYQRVWDDTLETFIRKPVEVTREVARDVIKRIVDGEIDSATGGSVSITVPANPAPEPPYTLEVLTYKVDDTYGLNYMLEYAKSDPFNIDPATDNDISVTLAPIEAPLIVPSAIVSGDTYVVSIDGATKSEALRDDCYIRQGSPDEDMSGTWFVHEDSDVDDISGDETFTLEAPEVTTNGNLPNGNWALYHQGQFFISDTLLSSAEAKSWQNWIFDSPPVESELLPMGKVNVGIE